MIEAVLERKNVKAGAKLTIKSLVALGVVALAAALPQIVHLVAGAEGGMRWLPMYLPVLLGGCLLGRRWGLGAGIASPLVSFTLTSLAGNAMPAASRLPYMIAELAVFGAVSGAFAGKIVQNGWTAFAAVVLAQVSGRALFLALAAIFQGVSPLSAAAAWSQISAGLFGMVLQAVLVSFLVMGLRALLLRERE